MLSCAFYLFQFAVVCDVFRAVIRHLTCALVTCVNIENNCDLETCV